MFLFGSSDSIVLWDVLRSHLEPSQSAKQAKSWCAMIQKSNSSAFSTEERQAHQVSSCHLLTTPHHPTNIYQFGINWWLQQLDESLKLQTDLNICRAAFKFKASLEQRQTSIFCIRTSSATWNFPIENTLTPPLPTEESHRSCSRIAHCGR